MEKFKLSRLIIYSSTVCNLRCKLCSEYIPYLPNEKLVYSVDLIKKALCEYFKITSYVKTITISGGEPFLSGSTVELIEFLLQFSDQYSKLEIMTNASVLPSEKLVEAMRKNSKVLLFVNDYGWLSEKKDNIIELCKALNIEYKLRIYHGINAHCGGWYDMQLLSGDRVTDVDKLKDRFAHCQTGNNLKLGLSFGLFENRLFVCAMSGVAERLGLIEDAHVSVDLCDDTLSIEQKRERIISLQKLEYLTTCSVCHGNDDRATLERFVPAEQLY